MTLHHLGQFIIVGCLVLWVLAGCCRHDTQWTKEGATEQDRAQALLRCDEKYLPHTEQYSLCMIADGWTRTPKRR